MREGFRIALGGVAAKPWRARDAEAVLTGATPDRETFRQAAEAALRRAIQLDPQYGSAHNNLAVIYLTQTPPQIELARWHYQKALAAGQPRNEDLEKLFNPSDPPVLPPASQTVKAFG